MVELVVVLVVIGIISIIAIPKIHAHYVDIKILSAARQIAADIRGAQALAMSEHDSAWVVFDDAANSYSIYTGTTYATRTAATDFYTQGNFTKQLNTGEYINVVISGLNIGSRKLIGFDHWGNTPNSGDITLNSSKIVRVTQSTGMVEIVDW